MGKIEELEEKIAEAKAKLVKLEEAYEKEEDDSKIMKLEYAIGRKDEQISKLIDRQQNLLDREVEDEDKIVEEEDEGVCPECGGGLILVGKDDSGIDVYECELCHELFLDE